MNWGKFDLFTILACTFSAALMTLGPDRALSSEPVLRVDVGTHSAGVYSIAMDSSNRIFVTGSGDKTVRIWDITDEGELLRTLRPPIGEGEEGQIFAVALSQDAQTVACGGRTGSPQQGDACVYLFDRDTGALTRRLGGLPGWIQHLAYTPDGRFLVAVTGEGDGKSSWASLRIYQLPDYTVVAEDRDYGDFIKWAESDPSGARLATACYDGFIRLYDLSVLEGNVSSPPRSIAPVSKIRSPGGQQPWGLAFSPDGNRLAVGFRFERTVDVLDVKGNTLEYAYSPDMTGVKGGKITDLRSVAWSSDGDFLYAGGSFRRKKVNQVRRWDTENRNKSMDLSLGVDHTIFQLLPLRAGGVIFGSYDGSFGLLDNRDDYKLLGPQSIPIFAANPGVFLLSSDGSEIQFSYERSGKSLAIFSVKERSLTESDSMYWADLKSRFTLQAPITEGLPLGDWRDSTSPKLNGKSLKVVHNPMKSLAIKPDGSGFLLGSTSHLQLFDSDGMSLWRFRMPGTVWAINTNGQVAVAALSDGTIRWYRLTDGDEILALFPHPDRKRWVLWTPAGYYDASPGGEDFIGWHVNNGQESAADFFPVSRFRSTFSRPDIIDRVLKTLDETQALQQTNEESGRKPAAEVTVRDKLPPVVTISSPADGGEVSTTTLKVSYSSRSHELLTRLRVLVDGRPVSFEGAGQPVQESGELLVAIPPRDCEVSIIAENSRAVSEPATVRLRWQGVPESREAFQIKPKLYVLAVGISQYQDADLTLGLAAKDALDFSSIWSEQKGQLYSSVETRVLSNEQATKGNILDGLEWIQRQVTQMDVAVLFFAGHGINDSNGMFYFLPVEADLERLKRTGISQSDITSTVTMIAGKVLVFMDACHSGNLLGEKKRRGLLISSAVVNELSSAENGAIVFSSSTGRQYSQEKPEWGNGAFTKGLVEGLSGKADFKGTGRITVNMLDLYASERVKELTMGQQTTSTVKPPNVPDFPIVAK